MDVEQLRAALDRTADTLNAERALADDLADVLDTMSQSWTQVADDADVYRVLTRYREARGRAGCQWCGMKQGHTEMCEGFNVNDPARYREARGR